MNSSEPLPPARQERTDGEPRLIALAGCGLALGVGLTLAASAWIYRVRYREAPPTGTAGPASSFPHGPRARTGVAADWAAQDALVRERLETYGWVDREAGVARIPIERAIDRVAAEAAGPPPEAIR